MRRKIKNLRLQCFVLLTVVSLVGSSQNYEDGSLAIYVSDPLGIPEFVSDSGGTSVQMLNPDLENLFNNYGVYSFDRAFPAIDSFSQTNKFGIDSIYTLLCTGDDSLLMLELKSLDPLEYGFVERIPIVEFIYEPNDYHLLDPQFNNTPDYALDVIRAQEAWDITHGSNNVKLGIVDQGFFVDHEDFGVNHEQIEYIADNYPVTSHGTFVAGLVACKTDNFTGKSSIGFESKMYIGGMGNSWAYGYDLLLDLFYHGAQVLNCSWKHNYSLSGDLVVQFIYNNGGLIVAAADNGGTTFIYPACYENVLTVSSTGPNDEFEFLNPIYGYQSHTHHARVDVCAPGHLVRSLGPANTYNESSGTSFASPIVTGLAGLVLSEKPNASPKNISDIIKWSCKYIDDINPKYANRIGYGRIDAYKAVNAASLFPSNASDYSIYNDVVWDEPMWVNHEIRIHQGAKLTIESLVFFNEDAKVVVERGGFLVLDGGYLTSFGEFLWNGIEVWGDKDESQYNTGVQGEIRLKNRASISHAKIAILTTRTYGTDHTSDEYNGGIIKAKNSIFTNNCKSIEFRPYENYHTTPDQIANNLSYFRNCLFEYEKDLSSFGGDFQHLVKLSGVRGIDFYGCDFRYAPFKISFQIPMTDEYGMGIYSENSGFLVDVSVSDINGQIIKPCIFNNLYTGIRAEGIVSTKTVSVNQTIFDWVFRGIYLGGITNPTVTSDTILLSVNHLASAVDTSYGLYLDHCTGYKIEENTIRNWHQYEPLTGKKAGIVINNSGPDYNEIYKNFVHQISVGILAQNSNRALAPDYGTGLKLYCNECSDNQYDLVVNSNISTLPVGISKYQGYYVSQYHNYPSGNLFSKLFQNIDGDYNNEAMFLNYYHHDPLFEPRVYPEDYSESSILRINTNEIWTAQECPSKLEMIEMHGSGYFYNEMTASNVSADSVSSTLLDLTDGGNTTNMVTDVSMSFPDEAWEVYTDLMNESPYLSDTVMEEAILKENVLAEPMVRDVLVANQQAAKSDEVMNTLNDRVNPLPDYMIQEIEQGKTVTSAKEELEAEASFHKHNHIMARNELMRFYINDTINPGPNDSLLYLLQINNSDYASYMLATSYLEKGDISNMNATLNAMNSNTQEYQDYQTFFGIMASLKGNGLTVYDIDSTQQQQLQNLAAGGLSRVNIYARNILKWLGQLDYSEILLIPDGSPKSEPIRSSNHSDINASGGFNVYPNPTNNYAILEWDVDGYNSQLTVRIINVTGKSVKEIQLSQTTGQEVLNLSGLPSGTYLITLYNNNEIEASKKLIIR